MRNQPHQEKIGLLLRRDTKTLSPKTLNGGTREKKSGQNRIARKLMRPSKKKEEEGDI
jgi:hypothetical protein